MKRYALPRRVRLILFDLDNTVYRHDEYVAAQIDLLHQRLAQELDRDVCALRVELDGERDEIQRRTGNRPSMAATFARHGVPIETSAAWRAELFHPERYLCRDDALRATLDALAPAALAVVSNNPVSIAERTLMVLGVADYFSPVVGLDTCMRPKPDPCGYRFAYDRRDVSPAESVAVGDRFAVDLLPVLELGGGAIELEPGDTVYNVGAILGELVAGAFDG